MSLSNIVITGRLKSNPTKKFTPTNVPVANLFLEVAYVSRGQQSADAQLSTKVIRVTAWRDLANECENSLKAGDTVLVSGRMQINSYTTNDGKKKREVEVDATTIVPLQQVFDLNRPEPSSDEESSSSDFTKEKFATTPAGGEQSPNLDEAIHSTEEIPF